MSAIAQSLRRQWLPLVVAASVCLVASLAWVVAAATSPQVPVRGDGVAAPAEVQAPWKVRVSLEGRDRKLTPAQKAAYNRERPAVVGLIEDLYDGIFLNPSRLRDVIDLRFSKGAASSLRGTRLGLPKAATDVRTTRRAAQVGIQATGARFAAARVVVIAGGVVGKRQVRVAHNSTLWLERGARKDWHVIGFDVSQRPAPERLSRQPKAAE